MSARSAAAFSALLLSGATAAWAGSVELAELVPVEPSLPPAMMYGIPNAEPEPVPLPPPPPPPAARPGPGPGKEGAAELEDGWEGGAARDRSGKFAYCVIEGRFNSGHVLMIARSPRGETNLGIGIPGAGLPRGQEWPVRISVDGKLTRERLAVASQPDMLVVPNGRDEELVNALMAGNELVVSSAADRIAFALKGTKKVLTDLKTCVDKGGDVPPIKTSTGAAPKRLPPGLADLLAAAGVRDAEMVPMDNVPREQRPADVAWRFGPIVGGIRERVVEEGAKLEDLSQSFTDAMKSRCDGKPSAVLNQTEKAGAVSIRTGAADCAMKEGTLHVSLTFLLTQNRLFTVLFHEAAEPDIPLADKVRDNLAQVLSKVALDQSSTVPPAGQTAPAPTPALAAPAAPAQAEPAAPPAPIPAAPPPAAQKAVPPVPPAVLSGKPQRR